MDMKTRIDDVVDLAIVFGGKSEQEKEKSLQDCKEKRKPKIFVTEGLSSWGRGLLEDLLPDHDIKESKFVRREK